MNAVPFSRDLALAFSRPFGRGGWKAMLFSFVALLVPIAGYAAQGAAYSVAAGRRENVRGWLRLGLRILAADLLLAAPALLTYEVIQLSNAYFASMPLLVRTAMLLVMLLFIARLLVLMPAAACCLALGAPMRIAVSGSELKRVISGSMGRYLLSALFSLLMLFLVGVVTTPLPTVLRYLIGAALVTLYRCFSAGLFMGCCRHSLGLAPPRDGTDGGGRGMRRAMAFLLALVLLAGLPLRASAAYDDDVRPINPQDGSSGQGDARGYDARSYAEAYDAFSSQGLLGYGKFLEYDSWEGRYYVREDIEHQKTLDKVNKVAGKVVDLTILTADVVTDFVPYVGQAENAIQTAYFGYKAMNTDDPAEKQRCTIMAGYKAANFCLGGFAYALKGGQAAAGGMVNSLVNSATTLERTVNRLDAINLGLVIFNESGNAVSAYDIVQETDYGKWVTPDGVLRGAAIGLDTAQQMGRDVYGQFSNMVNSTLEGAANFGSTLADLTGQALLDPFTVNETPQSIMQTYVDQGYVVWLDPNSPVIIGGPTPYLPGEFSDPALPSASAVPVPSFTFPPIPAAPGSTPAPTATPEPTPEPTESLPDPAGRYVGTQEGPDRYEGYGAVVLVSRNPVYITIRDDLTASFETTIESNFTYSAFGAEMNGSGSVTVRQEGIPGESVGGDEIRYYFKTRAATTTHTSYSGQMYTGGGDVTYTTEAEYEVWFTAYLHADGSVEIRGEMLTKPDTSAGQTNAWDTGTTSMTFTCTRS